MTSPPLDAAGSSAIDTYAKLLSLASHEFRTPVSVVGGYLRMLLRDPEAAYTDRQRHMIEEAEKSCARMTALLAELSELARLDAGTASIAHGQLDLFRIIGELAPTVLESSDRGVHLEVRGADAGATVVGDQARVRDAFAALFRAVLREQPAACAVAVDRRLIGRTAAVAVAPLEELDRIWSATPSPFNEHQGGLGLALPIARRVIERHGGRLSSIPAARSAAPASSPGAILVTFDLDDLEPRL